MATLETLIANVVTMRKHIAVYLAVKAPLSLKQREALATDLRQLDRNLAALAAYQASVPVPVAPPVPVVAVVPAVAPEVPNFGESDAMSSGLYNDWVSAWIQRTFPEAYRDWPPTVYAIGPHEIVEAAKRDSCLAQVCSAGTLGHPTGPYDAIGDWSLYTALTSTSTDSGGWNHQVWHMGKLVGEKVGGTDDGLEFAASLGFNW